LYDPAWKYTVPIDGMRWNQVYPYQLVMMKNNAEGYSGTWLPVTGTEFTLPVPPESLSRQTPTAIVTTVTQGGIVEEHNGAPIRSLSINGSTGVFPIRGYGAQSGNVNDPNSIFSGSISSSQGVQVSTNIASTGPGALIQSPNLLSLTPSSPSLTGSGYYQFRLLERWIEQYLALKKTPKGKHFVIGFSIAKEEIIYLCNIASFSLTRSASSPLEYNYSIHFKVWGSVPLVPQIVLQGGGFTNMLNPSNLYLVLSKLQNIRENLAALQTAAQGFLRDFQTNVMEPLRQTAFYALDSLSAPISCSDLPSSIVQGMAPAILQAATTPASSNNSAFPFTPVGNQVTSTFQNICNILTSYANTTSIATSGAGTINTLSSFYNNTGLNGADPAVQILSNPQNYYSFFQSIKPGQLNLSNATIGAINKQRKYVRNFTQSTFEGFRDQLQAESNNYALACGAMPAAFATIYNLQPPTTTRTPTDTDYKILENMNAAIIQMNKMALEPNVNNQVKNSMQFMAALAAQSNIPFVTPTSKFAIPFPYGSTLETLAYQYLGDTNRWPEIAALNNLRSPYVDEVGFTMSLLSNGVSNYVIVSNATLLYTGQTVYLSSNSTARTYRTIIGVQPWNSTSTQVILSGNTDLARFTTAAQANLTAFLPGTINSTKTIFIPSTEGTDVSDFIGKPNPAVTNATNYVLVGGADLLLTSSNDLVITPNGDQPLSIGLANIIQRARLAFSTPQGSLLEHPTYGISLQPGMSIADFNAQQIALATQNLFSDDPAYIRVSSASVNLTGPVAQLNAQISVMGTSNYLPLSFTLNPVAGP
jgi:hypothetical protein